jgi:hypothetical protein
MRDVGKAHSSGTLKAKRARDDSCPYGVRLHWPADERGKLEIGERSNRPAVPAIGIHLLFRYIPPSAVPVEQWLGLGLPPGCKSERTNCLRESGTSRSASRCVLLPQKLLRLGRPRHQFAIQAEPIRSEFIPKTGVANRLLNSL